MSVKDDFFSEKNIRYLTKYLGEELEIDNSIEHVEIF
jgi:hypothetical protein